MYDITLTEPTRSPGPADEVLLPGATLALTRMIPADTPEDADMSQFSFDARFRDAYGCWWHLDTAGNLSPALPASRTPSRSSYPRDRGTTENALPPSGR